MLSQAEGGPFISEVVICQLKVMCFSFQKIRKYQEMPLKNEKK